jgi:hypothetical protein
MGSYGGILYPHRIIEVPMGHSIILGSLFLTTQDTSYISQTIIYGDSLDAVITLESAELGISVITGFTIQNGSRGIACGNHASPTISHNLIKNNSGGISCAYCEPLIEYNIIQENISSIWYGRGGISCYDADPLIRNNIIRWNSISYNSGGGIYIYENTVENFQNRGGGISCENSNPQIINNTIWGNYGYSGGGGIYCGNASPLIKNNSIYQNSAYLTGL